MQNLYGCSRLRCEAKFVGRALKSSASRQTAHPEDRWSWTPANPTHGHCDLFVEICKLIWGRNLSGDTKWEPEAKILVWWAYADLTAFESGPKKNKLTVHYSFNHPKYGEIDLSRDQFPQHTYLHPRPKPLSHILPIGHSWDASAQMKLRKTLIGPDFIYYLQNTPLPHNLTPELTLFLELMNEGETFGLK